MRTDFRIQTLWAILAALGAVLITRLSIMPGHLYSFDSVNLALALENFNPARNQPQPPGYPFFIGEARLVNFFFGDPSLTFTVVMCFIAALTIAAVYWLGRTISMPGREEHTGRAAAALLAFAPTFWFSSLTSPLRMHLALFSALVGAMAWRALQDGDRRWFYGAALVAGVAGGFRPELVPVLAPLLLWVGWGVGRWRSMLLGIALIIPPTLIWLFVLVQAMGGPGEVATQFRQYIFEQGSASSVLLPSQDGGWRRMAARAALWTFIGTLAWIWALPWAWRKRDSWAHWSRFVYFLLLWFLPAYLFNLVAHTGDPDHTLISLPALCLVGGLCLSAAESRIPRNWLRVSLGGGLTLWMGLLALAPLAISLLEPHPRTLAIEGALCVGLLLVMPRLEQRDEAAEPAGHPMPAQFRIGQPLVFVAVAINILLFFSEFMLPQGRIADGKFRGFQSARDAALIGTFETSYRQVDWTELMTEDALADIAKLRTQSSREMVVVWTRDGMPAWRKVAYYYPRIRILALEELGDPATLETRARLWVGTDIRRQYRGAAPIQIDLPAGGRVVWLLAGGRESELATVTKLRKAINVVYTDLPDEGSSFQWGSFHFVAPAVSTGSHPTGNSVPPPESDETASSAVQPTTFTRP